MRVLRCFLGLGLLCCSASISFANQEKNVQQYLQSISQDPNALYQFFKEMPKGGELHYHLSGGAYPEMVLNTALQQAYCFNPKTWQALYQPDACAGISSSTLKDNPDNYQKIIRAWSLQDFIPSSSESNADHFFNYFAKSYAISERNYPVLLVDILQRAADQNESYLEIMVLPALSAWDKIALPRLESPKDFSKLYGFLIKNREFHQAVDEDVKHIAQMWSKTRELLACDQKNPQPACRIEVRFQQYALREQSIEKVFAQALLAFLVTQKSPYVVGVNFVQREDGFLALKDYREHMQVFDFLYHQYPQVPIALHAGELSLNLVSPEALRFHIQAAIQQGHARRIGHGVDIAYENNAEAILQMMRVQGIPVEVNLTSNAAILGVAGKQHPLNYYIAHQVPVVLSTDDEGILRTDLTTQYVAAVMQHHLSYANIKVINRNALVFSFLPPREKAQLLRQLEHNLALFEKKWISKSVN